MAYYEIALSWYNLDGTQQYIEDVEVTNDPQEKIPIIENKDEKKSAIENIPFFDIDDNDIEKLDEEEDEDENKDEHDDEDEEDDKKKDKYDDD